MKRFLTILVALFIIFIAPLTNAQPIESIPPGDDKIVSIKKGQPAPFDGQVFSNDTALRWANWLKQLRARLELDVKKEKDVCTVETKHRDELLGIERARAGAVEKDAQERLRRSEEARLKAEEIARNPPFYKTMEFGMIMGAITLAGVFALSVWAIDSTTAE